MPKIGQGLVKPEERELMVDMFLRGFEIDEIAETCNRNRETVYRQLRRAKVSLKAGKEAREKKRAEDGRKRKYTVTEKVIAKNEASKKPKEKLIREDAYDIYRKNALSLEGTKKMACDFGDFPDSEPVNCDKGTCARCYYGTCDKNKKYPCCNYALIEHKSRSLQGISHKACTKFRTNAQVREWKRNRNGEAI